MNRRTVHSLVRMLAMYPGVRLVYVSPASLQLPKEVMDDVQATALRATGVDIEQVLCLSSVTLLPDWNLTIVIRHWLNGWMDGWMDGVWFIGSGGCIRFVLSKFISRCQYNSPIILFSVTTTVLYV